MKVKTGIFIIVTVVLYVICTREPQIFAKEEFFLVELLALIIRLLNKFCILVFLGLLQTKPGHLERRAKNEGNIPIARTRTNQITPGVRLLIKRRRKQEGKYDEFGTDL